MNKILIILLFLPFLSFSQKKDYKNFDRAVKYNLNGDIEKAIKYAHKALDNTPDWNKPNLLLSSIYANNNQINLAADYLLKVYNENNPNYVKGIERLVELYYSNGFYNEALFYAEKILAPKYLSKVQDESKINKCVENCKFAIEAIKDPVTFNPKNLGFHINSEYEEYLPAISVNGKSLVYSRRFVKNNILQEDFFISEKDEDNAWKPSKSYGNNLNTYGNEGAFSFSADQKMAVFTACDRLDRVGRCDLYLLINNKTYNAGGIVNSKEWDSQGCFSPDGRYLYFVSNRKGGFGGKDIWRSEITAEGFLPPENLGERVNTRDDETSPFIHPDNLTLYFSSNGHIGMGDYDMYVCRRNNTQQEWSVPENMGYPINTHNTENSLIVDSDGKTAYYTSNQSGFGLEDIFVFDLPANMQADEIDGFEMDIITKRPGEEIILKNVNFDSNSFELDDSSFAELDKLIAYLIKNPDIQIEIQGHTDEIGSEIDNQFLSEKRAKVVFDYLTSKSNVGNHLSYKGYGELKPLVRNASVNGRILNRRTSFIIE